MHGVGDEYAITLHRDAEPLRIERDVAPIPVTSAERDQEERRVLNAMRWLDNGWRWSGPRIPETKPFFSGLLTGVDGRLWVLPDGPAYEIDDPEHDVGDPYDTEVRWEQERTADAFAVDGTYLGSVVMRRELDWSVPPVLEGDTMWAVARDGLGVQRVPRYELAFPADA